MKAADVRAKTDDELRDQLIQLGKERLNMRFQKASGQLESPARQRTVRHDMARIQTVLTERAKGIKIEAKPVKAKTATKKKAEK